jgi:hypothetical protein
MANKKNKKAEEGSLEEPSSVITPEKQPVESGDSLSEDSTLTDSSAPTQDPEPAKKNPHFFQPAIKFC